MATNEVGQGVMSTDTTEARNRVKFRVWNNWKKLIQLLCKSKGTTVSLDYKETPENLQTESDYFKGWFKVRDVVVHKMTLKRDVLRYNRVQRKGKLPEANTRPYT